MEEKIETENKLYSIRDMNKEEIFEEIPNSTYDNLNNIDYFKLSELEFNAKQWRKYFDKYTSKEWAKKKKKI